jgi:hypothetical protein
MTFRLSVRQTEPSASRFSDFARVTLASSAAHTSGKHGFCHDCE